MKNNVSVLIMQKHYLRLRGGKIPVLPNYLISCSANSVILRNYEGVFTDYKEPDYYEHTPCNMNCSQCSRHLKADMESDGLNFFNF